VGIFLDERTILTYSGDREGSHLSSPLIISRGCTMKLHRMPADTKRLAAAIAVMLVAAAAMPSAAGSARWETSHGRHAVARRETVLAWDDGNYGSPFDAVTGQAGMGLAVRFQAPPWARSIREIQYYIMDDQQENPANPGEPTTKAFFANVRRPSDNNQFLPGPLGAPEIYVETRTNTPTGSSSWDSSGSTATTRTSASTWMSRSTSTASAGTGSCGSSCWATS